MKRLIRSCQDINLMDKQDILQNLKYLDDKLREYDMYGEIDMFGGAVMCLGLNARQSTHDIDALFQPKSDMRQLIAEVAEEHNLPSDWINDGVKGFISPEGKFTRIGEDIFTNLTVLMTVPEYLFAMKCLSCRLGAESSTELNDIKFLINYLGLKSVDDAESLILQYYPESRYQPKTHYMLAEIFDQQQ